MRTTITAGFDPDAASDDDRYFLLSVSNLSLLYRHARIARALGLSAADLFQLLGFLSIDHLDGLTDIGLLLALHDWWKASGYRLDDIAVSLGQRPRDGTRYVDPAAVAAQVVASAATAMTFTDTVFAIALGTTEQGSRDLIAAIRAAAN